MMIKTFAVGAIALTLGVQGVALAASKGDGKDPYIAGFENYAKENSALSDSMKAYIKDVEKVVKQNPKLAPKPAHSE